MGGSIGGGAPGWRPQGGGFSGGGGGGGFKAPPMRPAPRMNAGPGFTPPGAGMRPQMGGMRGGAGMNIPQAPMRPTMPPQMMRPNMPQQSPIQGAATPPQMGGMMPPSRVPTPLSPSRGMPNAAMRAGGGPLSMAPRPLSPRGGPVTDDVRMPPESKQLVFDPDTIRQNAIDIRQSAPSTIQPMLQVPGTPGEQRMTDPAESVMQTPFPQKAQYKSAHPLLSPSPGLFNRFGKDLQSQSQYAGKVPPTQAGQQSMSQPIGQQQMPNFLPKSAKPEYYGAFTPELLDQYGVNTPQRKAHFMAQIAHESGGFKYSGELGGKNYFKKYEPNTKIGKMLGNKNPGDGYRYKGRGLIQLTGRDNYRRYGQKLGLDLENNPELAAVPENAAKIALEYWKGKGLNDLADQDNLRGITKAINGGYNGLKDRQQYYNKFKGQFQ